MFLWSSVQEAFDPDWKAQDLREFLENRANNTSKKRRLLWLGFDAMSWILWSICNKMVIGKLLSERLDDMVQYVLEAAHHLPALSIRWPAPTYFGR
jgi:hypothetical protein